MIRGTAPIAPIVKDEMKSMAVSMTPLSTAAGVEIWVDASDRGH